MSPPTFRVTAKIRNNRLVTAREKRGWSQAEAARRCGISLRELSRLECLRESPRNASGSLRPVALKIAITYELPADELFPDAIHRVTQPVVERTFDLPELPEPVPTPEDHMLAAETNATLADVLSELPTFEREVVVARYSEELTRAEVGDRLKCSVMRVQRAEAMALKKIRRGLHQRGMRKHP